MIMTSSQSFVLRRYFHLTENLILKFTSKSAKKGEEKRREEKRREEEEEEEEEEEDERPWRWL